MATKDFRAERVRLSTVIGSGSHPGIIFYSGSDASNFSGGVNDPAGLTAGVGNDVWFFVSGSKDSKNSQIGGTTNDGGVVLFGGDVVVSGTFYVDKMVVEIEESTTGSLSVSGSLYVSQSAFINQGLTVNLARGDSDNDNFIIKAETDDTDGGVNIFMADAQLRRVGVGTSQMSLMSGGADFIVADQDNQGSILLAREDTSIGAGTVVGAIHFGGTTDSGVNYSYNAAKIAAMARQTWDTSANNEAAELQFYTQDTGDTANRLRMTISEHGRVGIDTGDPMAHLQVGDHTESKDYSIFINKGTAQSGSLAFLNDGVSAAAIVLDTDEDLYIKNLGNNNDIIFQVEDLSSTPNSIEIMKLEGETSRIGIGFDATTGVAISPDAAVEIRVPDGKPSPANGLEINFNETGNYYALKVDSESTSYPAAHIRGKYGLEIKQDISSGRGLKVWRNEAEAGSEPLVYILESNASNTQTALEVRQYGTGDILELLDSGTSAFVVRDGGLVGINNSTPEYDLEVGRGGASDEAHIMIRAGLSASGSLAFAKGTGLSTGPALVYDKDENFTLVHSGTDKEIRIQATDASNNTDIHYLLGRDPTAGAQVLILSGGADTSIDPKLFKDTNLFVSGTIGSRGSSTRGTAVFGGDVYVSGAFYSDDINITDDLTVGDDLTVNGDLLVAEYIQHAGDTDTNFRFQEDSLKINVGSVEVARASTSTFKINHTNADFDFRVESKNKGHALLVSGSTDQVLILSGGGETSYNEAGGGDVSFYVSGSVGAKDGTTKGASVFGGDLVTSGTMYMSGTLEVINYSDSYIQFHQSLPNDFKIIAGGQQILTRDAAGSPDSIVLNGDGAAISALWKVNSKYAFGSLASSNKVFINSDTAMEGGLDTSLWVSGSIGSRGTTDRGTAVFGGDLHISGTVTSDNTSFGQWDDGGTFIYPADSSGAETVAIGANTVETSHIILHSTGSATFNQQGNAADFRVESNTKTHMLFVDGDEDKVGIGTATVSHTLNVAGGARFGGGSGSPTLLLRAAGAGSGSVSFAKLAGGSTGAALVYDDAEDIVLVQSGSGDLTLKTAGGLNYVIGAVPTAGASQVLVLSGTDPDPVAADPRGFTDCNFYVSGAIGQRGVHPKRGTSVFGGDLVASGNIYADNGWIYGPTDGAISIESDRGMTFRIDADDDESTSWAFWSGTGGEVTNISESGIVTCLGLDVTAGNARVDGTGAFSGSLLTVRAALNTPADFILKSDNGTDAGDQWRFRSSAENQTLGIGNDKLAKDFFADVLMLTGSNAAIDTSVATAGNLNVGGELNVPSYIRHTGDTNTYLQFGTDQLYVMGGGTVGMHINNSASPKKTTFSETGGEEYNWEFVGYGALGTGDTALWINGDGTSSSGASQVGILTNSPSAALHVNGDVKMDGAITLGNAVSDDITLTGRVASNIIPKTDSAYNLGSESFRFANIYTGDLHLRNDKGNWTIQEDSDKLIVINNLTGKKYKMMLSPLEDEE